MGYYLISDGIYLLKEKLLNKKCKNKEHLKLGIYMLSVTILTLIITLSANYAIYYYTKNMMLASISFLISLIPSSEIAIQIIQYILSKIAKQKIIPKMDYIKGIDKEHATFVVIPTILKKTEKVEELFRKLETYYLANKSENMYFALLGDASESEKQKEHFDSEIIRIGDECAKKLNSKYKKDIFFFLYRKRIWNKTQSRYLGWERKRGLLCEFNDYLMDKKEGTFCINTINELNIIPKIKYVITLDADTILPLNSGLELIGAMSHILNTPELSKNEAVVVKGHGIMQPRVGIDILSSRKSLFTRIYATSSGKDMYSQAISDIYQDNFSEGIFTGKGIYDIEVFHKVFKNKIPENTVLSHDLLEGNFLRAGLCSDILLIDGYPYKYNAYMKRHHRWIRGDWQLVGWLNDRDLNELSKYKIFDNLRRSLVGFFTLCVFVVAIIVQFMGHNKMVIWGFPPLIIWTPYILEIINHIVFKKETVKQKTFTPVINGIKGSVYRAMLDISFFPHRTYLEIDAVIRTIYRKKVSKRNLLEWTTAEEAEATGKTDLFSYYKFMWINVVAGIALLIATILLKDILWLMYVVGLLVSPVFAWNLSKEIKEGQSKLTKEENEYILEIGKKTWSFFAKYMSKEDNYLPPDNYQESRREKIAHRTSPTNIGLGILTILSAYDLGFIEKEEVLERTEKIIDTINKLPKWNGHLYNWYNTKNLEPLFPRYISSVDNGNFICYLYVLKQWLVECRDVLNMHGRTQCAPTIDIQNLENSVDNIIQNTDFSYLYDSKQRLFSIGFNIEENMLTDSYYDLLASEARQTSLVAIAKKDVPAKHWNNLSRTLTILNKYKGLVSWSGTAFEYLMPNIIIKQYPETLLYESSKFMIMSQQEYAKKLNIPWGISESAFYLQDLNYNYQYKAFGIPWLGLKRGLADDIVVSSYGTMLALPMAPKEVYKNLKLLESMDMLGKYGFYESIDFTPSRLRYDEDYMPIRTYMAHHQALIMVAINNYLNENIIEKRFSKNPEIKAVDILLQEKMPQDIIITKEQKEKVEKIKYQVYDNYSEKTFTKVNYTSKNLNVISNEEYTVCVTDKGEGFSRYKDIYINRFKETNENLQGIFFYIKNIRTRDVITNSYTNKEKYSITFSPDAIKIAKTEKDIEVTTKITVSPDDDVEIRRLEITNHSNTEEVLEVTSFLEPILSTRNADIAHPAFNNLFLSIEYLEETGTILVQRKKRDNSTKDMYMGVNLNTEDEIIGELEYEIDEEKFLGRNNFRLPEMVVDSKPLGKNHGVVTDPAVVMKKTVKIAPTQKVTIDLVISVSEDKEVIMEYVNKYKNKEMRTRAFELSKIRSEVEARYLNISGEEIEGYQKMLSLLIYQNSMKKQVLEQLPNKNYSVENLWKYGISGDLPTILIKIRDVNDLDIVNEILKAHEFFRAKNIKTDIIILNSDKNIYEQYVKEGIQNCILNHQVAYLTNTLGGIYVLNSGELTDEDIQTLEFRANIIFDAHLGGIKNQLE